MSDSPASFRPATSPIETLLESHPGLAVVGYARDGLITRFSAGAERLLGYKAANLVGQATCEVLHGKEEFARLLESGPSGQVGLEATTRTRDLLPLEGTFLHTPPQEDGTEVLVLYQARTASDSNTQAAEPPLGAAPGSMQSQREAEFLWEMIQRTAEVFETALSVHSVQGGMITYTNQAFRELVGVPTPRVIGMTLEQVLEGHPEARDRLTGYFEALCKCALGKAETPAVAHWEMDFPAGRRTVEVHGKPIAVEGYPGQFVLLIIEDTTERQRLQMQLVQSEKLVAMGQLAAGIAHEIRNPLATIYNALFDLEEIVENPSQEAAEDISIAMEEIKRVQDIINNLLDFARESERSSGQSDVNDVLRKTIRLIRNDLKGKSINVEWDLGEAGEAAISNNALKQILINLLTNAAQAMTSGGTLSLRTMLRQGMVPCRSSNMTGVNESGGTARLRLGPANGEDSAPRREGYNRHVVLEVADTGPGIPPDVMSNIFNPFYTTKPPGHGTGLGLSVVHSLMADCGGAVSVRSRPGEGTVFSLELPSHGGEMAEE